MTHLSFVKGHGTGNDFVLFADPDGRMDLDAELVRRLCDRRRGVGADGVIRAVRTAALPALESVREAAPEAEWFMDYWNADGSLAEMCGNGVRVYAHYLLEEGLAEAQDGVLTLGTRAGVRDVLVGEGEYTVDLGAWAFGEERLVSARGLRVARPGLGIDLGNPHVVAALADAGELQGLRLHESPVLDPEPAAGANVEFVVPEEPFIEGDRARIRMRVHERGVGETLSCGTGAAAAALAFRHWGGSGMPDVWIVLVPGGALEVRMFATADGEHVALSGPAELSYRGTIDLG